MNAIVFHCFLNFRTKVLHFFDIRKCILAFSNFLIKNKVPEGPKYTKKQ